ncbi:MAG TPA: type II secretion system protein [Planctomycetaceae bacterium]
MACQITTRNAPGTCRADLPIRTARNLHGDTAGVNPAARRGEARSGFTLVEMLVAVGLVVLMMTLFATIFQIATGAMQTQKGLAENDQRVRLVMNRLRNDLNGIKNDPNDPGRPYRTFRNVIPFGANEPSSVANFNPTDRLGYLYISENNPDDDTDDVLGLTVQYPSTASDQFFGQAAVVLPDQSPGASYGTGGISPGTGYPPNGSTTVPIAASPGSGQSYWPNQPDFDDILGVPNKTGNSPVAEVSYFLRKGTLYRRVLLVRDPNGITPAPKDGTPTDTSGNILSLGIYTGGSRDFWNDFDYSAAYDSLDNVAQPLRFHGTGIPTDSLAYNASGSQNPFALGNPAYRFGFDASTAQVKNGAGVFVTVPSSTYGQPREYVTTTAGATNFIGRFTHAETSDLNFGYPGSITTIPGATPSSPMTSTTRLNYDPISGRTGPPGSLFSGPRSGEDILMTNVLKFDVKVFDPAATTGPDNAYGVAGVDDDNNGTFDDISELGWPGSDDGDFRDIGHLGTTGYYASFGTALVADFDPITTKPQRIYGPTNTPVTSRVSVPNPPPAPLAANYNSFTPLAYPNLTYNYGNIATTYAGITLPTSPPFAPFANRFDTWNPALDFIGDGTNDSPPFRPFSFGADGRPGAANFDDDGNGKVDYVTDPVTGLLTPDPREIGWPNSDDQPAALSAIQIKITFYDVTSNQVREITLVQSLLYTP